MDIIFGLLTLFLTIVALLIFIHTQNDLHRLERRELLDRILKITSVSTDHDLHILSALPPQETSGETHEDGPTL
jgi:hypothetical protein